MYKGKSEQFVTKCKIKQIFFLIKLVIILAVQTGKAMFNLIRAMIYTQI